MCYLRSLVRVLAREYIIKVMEIRQYNAYIHMHTSICMYVHVALLLEHGQVMDNYLWHWCLIVSQHNF